MKKLYIAGGMYGCNNIGDQAVLESTLKTFSRSNTRLAVLTKLENDIPDEFNIDIRELDLYFVEPKYGLSAVPRKKVVSNWIKIRDEKKFIKGVDGFICGGGTVLSDCPWFAMTLTRFASEAGKPSITWGSGIADGNNDRTMKYIVGTLNDPMVKRAFVRDELVAHRLAEAGVLEEKIDVCYDPAIMLEAENFEESLYLTEEQIQLLGNGKMNVAISISGEKDVVSRTPLAAIEQFAVMLKKKYDCNIFIIPSGCGKHCADMDIAELMEDKLGRNVVTAIKHELKPTHMIALLRRFSIMISSRLHMNIFSACGGGVFLLSV